MKGFGWIFCGSGGPGGWDARVLYERSLACLDGYLVGKCAESDLLGISAELADELMVKKLEILQGFDPDVEKSVNVQEVLARQGFRVDSPEDGYDLSKIFNLSTADNKNSGLKFTFEFTV